MKLITEQIEEAKFTTEEVLVEGAKSKNYFIEGVFLQHSIKNRNGRVYPKDIMVNEATRYIKEMVDANRAFGELGHPTTPTIGLDRASHIIKTLKEDGNNYVGKAKILNTPMGKITQALIDEGATLGVSSRGIGSLVQNSDGSKIVQKDFQLATAADIVADPSAPAAFVQGIMEGREWVCNNGIWSEQVIEETKNKISKLSGKALLDEQIKTFERLLRTIK